MVGGFYTPMQASYFAFLTTFRSLLFDRGLDQESARALVDIIVNDLRQCEQSQLVQMARNEELLFLRFLSRIENTSDAPNAFLKALEWAPGMNQKRNTPEAKQGGAMMISQLAAITPRATANEP